MTEPLGFGIFEDAFFDDPRLEQRSDLAQRIFERIWIRAAATRFIGLEITDELFNYLCRRFHATEEEVEAALVELSTPQTGRRRGKPFTLKPLIRYDGKIAVMLGIAKKHRTVRRWHDEKKYPQEFPSMGIKPPTTEEITPETGINAPSSEGNTPSSSPERERNGTERNENGKEHELNVREDQQPLGSSPPPEDPEPPPGSSPPQRSVRSHDSKPRTPELPNSTASKSGTPETPGGGKRPLPSWGEGFLQELHEAMSRGEPGIVKAQELLKCRMGLNVFQALKALKTDPQRLCEWCYSAMTEGKNPTGLLVQYLKSTPDFRDVPHIYGEVKRILFEVPEGTLMEVLAGGQR